MEFLSYDIESNDFRRAGAASRSIKEHLKRIGADAEAIRRTMIAAYEAEMNVVIHSVGGRLKAAITDSGIDVDVIDGGPGIPDVEQAMIPGFSTASAEARALGFGAGMGLPNIKQNSDRLHITSRVGEGTRVSFTVRLKPETTDGALPTSLYASADRCRDCRACLSRCPTQAMRVREGRPSVLEHLCIDCADCIAACTSQALTVRGEVSSLDDIAGKDTMLLAVPPALLAGCGPDYTPSQVLAALQRLGFAGVITSAPYEEALTEAALAMAAGRGAGTGGLAGGGPGADGQAGEHAGGDHAKGADARRVGGDPSGGPLIVPSCPAVVNLIELRFPSLVPLLAPFDSPWEALQAVHGDRPVTYVVSCPSQRSALLAHAQTGAAGQSPAAGHHGHPQPEYISPEIVRQAAMVRLTGRDGVEDAAAAGAPKPAPLAEATSGLRPPEVAPRVAPLTVTGMRHVIGVLEEVEDGLLEDVSAIEPYACEGGCFGSPLLAEDHHVAALRWSLDRAGVAAVEAAAPAIDDPDVSGTPAPGAAVTRRRSFVARPGIRLDSDMGRAIEKLGRMQEIIGSLPGRDCGTCGAPTCAALAEDIVMERAGVGLCPYIAAQNGAKEDEHA